MITVVSINVITAVKRKTKRERERNEVFFFPFRENKEDKENYEQA